MEDGLVKFSAPKEMRILSEDGTCDEANMPKLGADQIKKMYEQMVLARAVDDRILKLQREGRCGTYASSLGEEATQVGTASALEKSDWLFPYFRELGAHVVRGFPMDLYLLYWMGSEEGSKVPEEINDLPICIPVSTQMLHATGAAMAMKFRKEKSVSMVYFGDGGTSEGDFHEGMNFAGVFKAPVIFVCQNNKWAISVPLSKQTASETIAQKAVAYGFPGVRVDGNDVFAVFKAAQEAVERARIGGGPTLIECMTYRMSDHTTADDAKRYRPEGELQEWAKRDPIERLRLYMKSKGMWDESYEKELKARTEQQVEEAVRKAEAHPAPAASSMFDFMYEKLPKELAEQRTEMLREAGQ